MASGTSSVGCSTEIYETAILRYDSDGKLGLVRLRRLEKFRVNSLERK